MDPYVYTPSDQEPLPENRYMFYEYLHFIPEEQKNTYWAAQCMLFNKLNSTSIVDPSKAVEYRRYDQSQLDIVKYKHVVDPPQSDGTGGKAEYFAANWKANPIDVHLNNILEARLDKLGLTINVSAADEYFQTNLQKEGAKILGRKKFLEMLNDTHAQLGLPRLRPDEDPYRYVQQMQRAIARGEVKAADTSAQPATTKDLPTTLLDNIRTMIEDNEDLALYNEYVHKDGVEIACELGAQYYLDVNKFAMVSDKVKADLRNFNASAMRFYTSATTGRPVLEYLDPSTTYTQPFKEQDASDCTYWWREYEVTFGEFVRQFGANLTTEQLKAVFERNRMTRGNGLGTNLPSWDECSRITREQTLIKIGYMEVQTQDIAVYGSGTVRGNYRFKRMPASWSPAANSPYKKEARYFNCWYKWYYLPLYATNSGATQPTSDFDLQAQFIFDFGKLQDQLREGDDQRYARSSLVAWRKDWPSFTDVKERWMPQLHLLYLQYQNDLANAGPAGEIYNETTINEMMNVVDEAQNDGKDSGYEVIRRLKQTGRTIMPFTTEDGKRMDPVLPYNPTQLGVVASRLTVMMQIYALMTQSLGINEIAEGVAPQPRQSATGIQLAMVASNNATYLIEKGFVDIYTELGYRLNNYFKDIVMWGDSERLREFEDIVGQANSWALEAVKDIPWRRLGVTVEAVNNSDINAFINQMALEMAKGQNPMITPDEAIGLTFIKNVKYKYALLRLRMRKRQRELMSQQMEMATLAQQAQAESRAYELEKIRLQAQAVLANTELTKRLEERLIYVEGQVKTMGQLQVKDKIRDSRIEENAAILEQENNLKMQAPLV